MIYVRSPGMQKIPFLSAFLDGPVTRTVFSHPLVSAVAVWGHRPTAKAGETYARTHDLPLLRIEDGFLRSLDLGCHGAPPLSLVVDTKGIYYDASTPSDLEDLLEHASLSTALLTEAETAIDQILKHDLSKYNHAPKTPPGLLGDDSRSRVVLLDQTRGDKSIALGGADQASFKHMLEAARKRFPDGRFFIKTHPDVIAGKKQGYLTDHFLTSDMTIIACDYTPLSLLAQADAVFTVTSQMGFEALLLGKEVHCFGLPFYAGWGVTRDKIICSRRTRRRSVVEIFAAAYMLYSRYVNPFTGKRCTIHEIISILVRQREMNEQNAGHKICLCFDRWKRPHAKAFLFSTRGSIRFCTSSRQAMARAQESEGSIVVWSSRCRQELKDRCARANVKLIMMEDGFIRSCGLGSDFHCPYSLVLDDQGIYYDPSRPSRLESILQQTEFSSELLTRAASLRQHIVTRGITKYNIQTVFDLTASLPRDKKIVLVPGQVEDDASVCLGGCGIASNLELLEAVRKNCPDACILYKPHPDVERNNRKGQISDETALRHADHIIRDVGMHQLLSAINEVHTLTSLTGFEALLRGISVQTYGGPFYAGWGLTKDRATFPRRQRTLALDELVAGTLILYPCYFDWQTAMFCGPEEICSRLQDPLSRKQGKIWVRLVWRLREFWKHCSGR